MPAVRGPGLRLVAIVPRAAFLQLKQHCLLIRGSEAQAPLFPTIIGRECAMKKAFHLREVVEKLKAHAGGTAAATAENNSDIVDLIDVIAHQLIAEHGEEACEVAYGYSRDTRWDHDPGAALIWAMVAGAIPRIRRSD
jgi:hypothetical protein